LEEALHSFRHSAYSAQAGPEASEEIGGVDAGQANEKPADRIVADVEEDNDPENR
jgi:hypothetical protein